MSGPVRQPREWTYAELMAAPLCDEDDCTWCDEILREIARRNIDGHRRPSPESR